MTMKRAKKALASSRKAKASVAIVFPLSRGNAQLLCEKCEWNEGKET